ncbi:MAG: glycosyltransferase, partial [Oscillospiraceae bacterium]
GNPKNLKFMLWLFLTNTIYNQKPLYLLATSAYAAGDFACVGAFKNKAFKWGYFPQGSSKSFGELLDLKKKNEKPIILWAARMLPLKHGEMAIKTAEYLKNKGLSFTLKMVGDGEQETQLKQMAKDKSLENCIEFLGSLPYDSTINQMENADIFIFSSDENEGWGAVVNESMSAACAVVACNSAGSVPFLIEDGENGFSYDFDDEKKLFSSCEKLIINSSLREKIAENAFKNINETWNGKTAAKNLVALSKAILNKTEQDIVKIGPGSKC